MRLAMLSFAVLGLGLAACRKEPPAPKPGVDPTQALRDAAAKMDPGKYRVITRVENIELPNVPGMPADMAEQMKAKMQANMRESESCLTREEADKGPRRLMEAAQKMHCTYDRFDMKGGEMEAAMHCDQPGGSKMTATMLGTFSKTGGEVVTQADASMPGGIGSMKMTTRIRMERIGDCAG